MKKLKTERNTKTMGARVKRAFRKSWLGSVPSVGWVSWRRELVPTSKRRRVSADFEHGQWWITDLDTGAQWSVVDAEGKRAVDGFDFEQVTEGEEIR